jgi:uncharacterized membrane protein YfcA
MTRQLVAGFALTGLVGASLGLLGAGGSIIMLPVLVYVVGVDPHAAVPLSLAIVGTTSLVGVAVHAKSGDIRWGTALLVGGAALGGTYLGSRLTSLVPGSVLLLTFGLLLVLVGFRMWRSPDRNENVTTTPQRPPLMLAVGSFVGLLTGFLGVGGGFLIVPALVKVGGLGMCPAIRTSLVVIAMSSVAGVGAHLAHGNGPSVEFVIPLTIAAVVGMMAGSHTARYVNGEQLRRGFAGFVTTVGSVLIFVNGPTTIRLLG